MAVNDRVYVWPRAIRLAVDETLEKHAPVAQIDWIGFEVEFHDVLSQHQSGRPRARQEIALRIRGMPDADMAPGIQDTVPRQDVARGDQIVDNRGLDRAGGGTRNIGQWTYLMFGLGDPQRDGRPAVTELSALDVYL